MVCNMSLSPIAHWGGAKLHDITIQNVHLNTQIARVLSCKIESTGSLRLPRGNTLGMAGGWVFLIINLHAGKTALIEDYAGTSLHSIPTQEACWVYCTDASTNAGVWRFENTGAYTSA